ncbi:hypothetical protein M407DRAFT_18634 [Tulasnella calospora MUT 4182]|uniref:Uncharacterized protein n=1 Tax=Tulasnella calospora MUT 4182 TaxID=1051891 RepID=A0A0C3QJA1_9AGAM|nr:hypothetical protein M407DRAFT_18634 [Tulasnella calospora MUT 4182]
MSSAPHSDSESSGDDREDDQDYQEDGQMEEVGMDEPETPPKKAAKASKRTQSRPKPPNPGTLPATSKIPAPSKPTTSTSNFNRFLGNQAELVRAAHKDSLESGYRPNKGTKDSPSGAGGSKKSSKDQQEAKDPSSKAKAGRKPKTEFSLRACVFLTQGVDAYEGAAGPDLGKCYQMQEWGLAVVADSESDLTIEKTANDADMENFIRKLFPQVFQYFDSTIASTNSTRRSSKNKAVQGHLITQVKSTGKNRKLRVERDLTIRGSAVVDRFPSGKSWEHRIAYFSQSLLVYHSNLLHSPLSPITSGSFKDPERAAQVMGSS